MVYILGDRPFGPNPQIGLSSGLTVDNGGWSSQNRYPRQLADVNGDNRADIVGFGLNDVYVSLANADGTFASAQVGFSDGFTVNDGGWNSQDRYPRQLADVNGDGLADIVGFGFDNVFVSLAKGDGTFEQAQIGLLDGFTVNDGGWSSDIYLQLKYPRELADVNGDGRADIVGFGLNDVYVSLVKEDGTFRSAQVGLADGFTVNDGWTSQDQYPRQLADVNEDGRIDIVGFGQDRIYVSLGNGDGTFFPANV
ncbi:VCBS repeat-containing protein [Leptolyngbya sp. FACHB-711]|uniref:FG-GAP repeat domain-containing protein n=1 Tax=Leptolyngbya sp. FACHB-711 TaxID=2692813 RepID=UPI0016838CA2|nr:VCBS repeat-containing protein [Leptolyngbya sp. FACHB-711]MBD2026812.1 VCBS repeat-containing protein [Leptolyngbya sp. FACHB-711]